MTVILLIYCPLTLITAIYRNLCIEIMCIIRTVLPNSMCCCPHVTISNTVQYSTRALLSKSSTPLQPEGIATAISRAAGVVQDMEAVFRLFDQSLVSLFDEDGISP